MTRRVKNPWRAKASEAQLQQAISSIHPRAKKVPGLHKIVTKRLHNSNTGSCISWCKADLKFEFEDWAKSLGTGQQDDKPPLDLFLAVRAAYAAIPHQKNSKFQSTVKHRRLDEWAEEQLKARAEKKPKAHTGDKPKASVEEDLDIRPSIEWPLFKAERRESLRFGASEAFFTSFPEKTLSNNTDNPSGVKVESPEGVKMPPPRPPPPPPKAVETPLPKRHFKEFVSQYSLEAFKPPPKKIKTSDVSCQTESPYATASTQTIPEKPQRAKEDEAPNAPPSLPPPTPRELQFLPHPQGRASTISDFCPQSPQILPPGTCDEIQTRVSAAIARETEALHQSLSTTIRRLCQNAVRDAIRPAMASISEEISSMFQQQRRQLEFHGRGMAGPIQNPRAGSMMVPPSRPVQRAPPARLGPLQFGSREQAQGLFQYGAGDQGGDYYEGMIDMWGSFH